MKKSNYLISHCDYPEKLGVCLDTCHIHDAGYDLSNFDAILDEFDHSDWFRSFTCCSFK